MIKVGVANISTPLEPRTAASATTELAGLLKAAALGAPFTGANRGFARRAGRFCGRCGRAITQETRDNTAAKRSVHRFIKHLSKHTGSCD